MAGRSSGHDRAVETEAREWHVVTTWRRTRTEFIACPARDNQRGGGRAAMSEHYTDGRRWSYISQAWIFADGWNDREEIARLEAKVRELEERLSARETIYLRDQARIHDLEAKLSQTEYERDEARTVNAATVPGTYWASKCREAERERDQLRARVERLESALRHIAEARWSPRTTASYDEDARYAYPERESYVRQYAQRALEGKEEHGTRRDE